MIIDLSKTHAYRTRDGRRAVVERSLGLGFMHHFVGEVGGFWCYWSQSGIHINGSHGGYSPADLVGPWEEPKPEPPVVDWAKFPAYFRYLAMDECGAWYGYYNKPKKNPFSDAFIAADRNNGYETMFDINPHDYPKFSGDWKDSLCERPVIASECLKPTVDVPWNNLPDWVEVVAMDKNGKWWGFSYIPHPVYAGEWGREARRILKDRTNDSVFVRLGGPAAELPTPPKFPGDWEDSIITRPGRNPIKDHN